MRPNIVATDPTEAIKGSSPLVSICITCYNHSAYICEAIDSALKQDYEKCEVVISDDCSTDDSDKVIREFIASYRASGGARPIIYHRNEHNLGIAKNYEKCFSLAHGELLITGSGDDISLPNRAGKIVEAWLASGKLVTRMFHDAIVIDNDGKIVKGKDYSWMYEDHPLGALTAYDRRVVTDFPPIQMCGAYEDVVYLWRAKFLGRSIKIADKLVLYREGGVKQWWSPRIAIADY